jgi:hypothetical protein
VPESIEIDDEVFAVLKHHAQPFVDTPNTVLRRLLGVDRVEGSPKEPAGKVEGPPKEPAGKAGEHARRAAPGTLLPEREYELPILQYLDESGGRAPSREVVQAVGAALADRLTELDRQELTAGDVRWENRVAFVRLRLVERGELLRGSPRGTWEISDQGRERLRSQ